MRNSFIVLGLLLSNVLFGQLNRELTEELAMKLSKAECKQFSIADKYYSKQEFLLAIPLYDSLYKNHPDIYLGYVLGSCLTYDAHHYTRSVSLIQAAEPIKENLLDYDYFMGRAYEVNDLYKEAIERYEKYKLNPIGEDLTEEVNHRINECKNAIELEKKGANVKVTNIGLPINTIGSEYTPILPSNEKFIIYTYRGEKSMGGKQSAPDKTDDKTGIYFEDIMLAGKDSNNNWIEPKPINEINTTGHDAAISISHDGQKLFIYRNVGLGMGDIFMSKLDGTTWSEPEKVKGINTNYWEGSVCLSPDEKVIYFSSERPGGYGGSDIYSARLLPDSTWGQVENLGPEINTALNEDAPFMHSDGKTMFFSSTGHNSIGGYDIFRSELKQDKWETPYNVGKPVNTVQDDKFYVVSADGQRGYYSSEKATGQGQQDIYLVEPGMFGKPSALVMVSGIVSYDRKPVKATISVRSKLTHNDFSGLFNSNSASGYYLVNLPSGNEYEISYTYLKTTVTKDISTALIDSFARLEINTDLYSDEYIAQLKQKADTTKAAPVAVKTNMSNEELVAKFGDTVIDSLFYSVQIGAYKISTNFNYAKLIGLPKVEQNIRADGITRFTTGKLSTLRKAYDLQKKLKKRHLTDAFIVATYKGERLYLEDLIARQILK
jgi:hypothetical protein